MDASAIASLFPASTDSPEETQALGTTLAQHLTLGDVIALYGDLGAGKTQLVKGICQGLGHTSIEVHSPTFTLVNEYETDLGPVYHFDAYRVEREEEFFDIGYEDYFFGDGICLVEWADRVEGLMPAGCLRLRLEHDGTSRRRIVMEAAP